MNEIATTMAKWLDSIFIMANIKIDNNNIRNIYYKIASYQAYLGIIIFRLTLDIVYIVIVNPIYGYSGFTLDFFAYKYIISWIVTLVMLPFIVNLYNNSSISSTIILLINLIYFIPGCTLYSLNGPPDSFFLFYVLYWVLLMIWQYQIPFVHFKLPSERVSRPMFYSFIFLIAIGAIAITGIYNDFQLNFRLDNIYELRTIRKNIDLPTIVRYFLPTANVVIPFAIVLFLSKRKYILSCCMIMIQFLLFSFGGEKYALFMIPVAIVGYYLYREKRIGWFSWGFVALNVLALFEFILRKSNWIVAYFQNRAMLMTNLLSYQYYDYFSTHTPDYLFQSLLRRFGFISQYDIQIPYLIGMEYYNDITISANNGMIGDAFSNCAWMGLVLFPLIVVLALRLMDSCSHGINRRLLITICLGYAISYTNVSFFTVLLTNGFLFMCFILFFMPREGELLYGKDKRR